MVVLSSDERARDVDKMSEDVVKSEALRLRPCQYIYMEGRTPYTTWDSWYPC